MLFSLFNGSLDMQTVIAEILACLLIIFIVLPFHEWAHGFVAYLLGDKTAKYSGRLSFSPLAHVDPFGALCLLLFNFGWAKPVPVNPNNFKRPKLGMAITALAGPAANVIASVVGGLLLHLLVFFIPSALYSSSGFIYYVSVFLVQYIAINACLAVFNLVPIPPLDGSKILFMFLPDRWVENIYRYQMFFFFIIYALLFSGILSVPLSYLQNGLINWVMWLTGLPFQLFS